VLAGCGQSAGTACTITGSGFTAKDFCANQCLSRWAVNCPDGSTVTPHVCSGISACTPGSCPQGQACYSFDDAFEERSYCIPDNVCGSPLSAGQLQLWEETSAATAADLREKYAAKRAIREGKSVPTEPTEPLDQNH
jgi:hypothetical protein